MSKENKNHKQDIEITKLQTEFKDFKKEFLTWKSNEFEHLRIDVKEINNRLLWGFIFTITSTLILQVILSIFK